MMSLLILVLTDAISIISNMTLIFMTTHRDNQLWRKEEKKEQERENPR